MSDLFPTPPGSAAPEPEPRGHLDPTRDVEEARRRWTLRAARLRARHLAEMVFGGEVATRLQSAGGGFGVGARTSGGADPDRLQGLLHLQVPFVDLEVHRFRERVFTACAASDPVLSRVPFVYVFAPEPAGEPRRPGAPIR